LRQDVFAMMWQSSPRRGSTASRILGFSMAAWTSGLRLNISYRNISERDGSGAPALPSEGYSRKTRSTSSRIEATSCGSKTPVRGTCPSPSTACADDAAASPRYRL